MLAVCKFSVWSPESRLADRAGDSSLAIHLSEGFGSQENERQSMDLCWAAYPGSAVLANLHACKDPPGQPLAAARFPCVGFVYIDNILCVDYYGYAP